MSARAQGAEAFSDDYHLTLSMTCKKNKFLITKFRTSIDSINMIAIPSNQKWIFIPSNYSIQSVR